MSTQAQDIAALQARIAAQALRIEALINSTLRARDTTVLGR